MHKGDKEALVVGGFELVPFGELAPGVVIVGVVDIPILNNLLMGLGVVVSPKVEIFNRLLMMVCPHGVLALE